MSAPLADRAESKLRAVKRMLSEPLAKLEPTSGLEPLTCSLRAFQGAFPPGSAGVRRRMLITGLGLPGIPPTFAQSA